MKGNYFQVRLCLTIAVLAIAVVVLSVPASLSPTNLVSFESAQEKGGGLKPIRRAPTSTSKPKTTRVPKRTITLSRSSEKLRSVMNAMDAIAWADRAKDYLVNTRGIEQSRIVIVDAGCRDDFTVTLWIVPRGALTPPIQFTQPCQKTQSQLENSPMTSDFFIKTHYELPAADSPANAIKRHVCPAINVNCPERVTIGQPLTFTAYFSGTSIAPSFNWVISDGTITSGQYTYSITVDTTRLQSVRLQNDRSITATVNFGGFDPTCVSTSSCTTNFLKLEDFKLEARKFDEFGGISVGDAEARLDNFTIELQNDPTAQGYIVTYARAR